MNNKYCDKVSKEIIKLYDRLAAFPGYEKYLKYDWHIWNDGYSDHLTLRIDNGRKKFWKRGWDILVHDVERLDCIYRALEDENMEIMVMEAMTEAKAFLIIKEKEMHGKVLDFDVKFKGLQETVKNALLEM